MATPGGSASKLLPWRTPIPKYGACRGRRVFTTDIGHLVPSYTSRSRLPYCRHTPVSQTQCVCRQHSKERLNYTASPTRHVQGLNVPVTNTQSTSHTVYSSKQYSSTAMHSRMGWVVPSYLGTHVRIVIGSYWPFASGLIHPKHPLIPLATKKP